MAMGVRKAKRANTEAARGPNRRFRRTALTGNSERVPLRLRGVFPVEIEDESEDSADHKHNRD